MAASRCATLAPVSAQEVGGPSIVRFHLTDEQPPATDESESSVATDSNVEQASLIMLQPALPLVLPIRPVPEAPAAAAEYPRNPFGGISPASGNAPLLLAPSWPGLSTVTGEEARGRLSSDAGSLLQKSPSAIGTGIQRRNPIINDPRIRGSRVGSMAASGSYWIPARIDLDTPISKIDSRILQQITIVPGPFNVLNGPGLQTLQFDLLPAPRFDDGPQMHGTTSADYFNNGQQFYGRQDVWGGSSDWGFRAGYGHRTGNDYQTGAGKDIPSSYNSRDVNFSFGTDLSPDSHINFSYLRIDQTDVELPGQAFDISYLSTDAYEIDYVLENQPAFDQLLASAWYNRTRLNGNAQRHGKRLQFPFFNDVGFTGNTDVDAMSTGYRLATAWDSAEEWRFIVGTDLRFLNQELNELTSALNTQFITVNSPIPDSNWVNPGIFAQQTWRAAERWSFNAGARADVVSTQIVDDPAKLTSIGSSMLPYSDIVGTTITDRTFGLWAAYLSANYQMDDGWSATFQFGHAERAPSLTELYVAQSFMFLLQNGLNTVTGDPRLAPEQVWQIDVALAHQGERFNGVVRAYQSWVQNYITYESLGVAPQGGPIEQVNLKYVNTQLATLSGFEMLGTYRWSDMLTPFGMMQYVMGEDQTRNGKFATEPADKFRTPMSSFRVYGDPRGSSDLTLPPSALRAKEPLPQIVPLDCRLGLRLHSPDLNPWWAIEISTRMVAPQHRVAVSLHELPTAGFAVGDLRAYVRPNNAWMIVGGIENFTDRNYREHLDFHPQGTALAVFQPGINFYSGVQLTY